MERLQIDLSPPAILELRAEAYFAVTTNSLQLGARVEMGADLGVASISGHFGFDALVVFSPHFMFMIDLGIGLTVRALGVTLCGVNIQLHLEGPGPWRAEGSAEVEILWWTVDIDVGPFTWGDEDNPPPAPVRPAATGASTRSTTTPVRGRRSPRRTPIGSSRWCRRPRARPRRRCTRSACSTCANTRCRWRR